MTLGVRGWRGRIGMIYPDDGVNDDEYWLYAPDGVTLLWTRFSTPVRDEPISPSMVDTYADETPLLESAKVLAITRPSVVAFGCNSCSFVRGPRWDLKQAEMIGAPSNAPGTTITTAMIAALSAMGIKRVALGAPYVADLTARFIAFLDTLGIATTATKSLGMTTEWVIGNSHPSIWYQLARKVDRPDAEAVVLACGGIRTAEILADLEADIGKPVIAAPAALMWHAAQLMRVDTTRHDRGRLFSEYGNAFASQKGGS